MNEPTERDDYYEPRIAKTPLPLQLRNPEAAHWNVGDEAVNVKGDKFYTAEELATLTQQRDELLAALTEAVVAEKNDFDLPADWIHRSSAVTGAPVGEQFVPKRMTPSAVQNLRESRHVLEAAATECHDAFVQWDILPADRCRSLRKMLRAAIAKARS